jgi:hypothetical protein
LVADASDRPTPFAPFVFFFVFFLFFFNAKDNKIFTKVTNKDAEGAKCNA